MGAIPLKQKGEGFSVGFSQLKDVELIKDNILYVYLKGKKEWQKVCGVFRAC